MGRLPEHAIHQPLGLGMKLRAHPLGIAIAGIQLEKLAALNLRRRAYVEQIEAGLQGLSGLRAVERYPGSQPGGFYGLPVVYEHPGRTTAEFIGNLNRAGIPAAPADSYPLLHRLPLFAQGYDLFTRNRGPLGGDYPGYSEGDFPRTEALHRCLVFLPVLSDAAPGATDRIIEVISRVARQLA
jgi:dTDP-4-amino-4,6-dideoxygalactose transaminase